MRKLLVMSVSALVGLAVNAATCMWDVDTTYKMGTSDAAEGWVAYVFDASSVNNADMISYLTTGTYGDYLTMGAVAEDFGDEDGYFYGTMLSDSYAAGETVNAYIVLFNSDDALTATYAYVSGIESTDMPGISGSSGYLQFGDLDATADATNWTAIGGEPVPEPTSGLLLLVGMAGLALRRKQK